MCLSTSQVERTREDKFCRRAACRWRDTFDQCMRVCVCVFGPLDKYAYPSWLLCRLQLITTKLSKNEFFWWVLMGDSLLERKERWSYVMANISSSVHLNGVFVYWEINRSVEKEWLLRDAHQNSSSSTISCPRQLTKNQAGEARSTNSIMCLSLSFIRSSSRRGVCCLYLLLCFIDD